MARASATDTLEFHRGKAVVTRNLDTGSHDLLSGFFAFARSNRSREPQQRTATANRNGNSENTDGTDSTESTRIGKKRCLSSPDNEWTPLMDYLRLEN